MTNSLSKLSDIHERLCHPGVTHLLHFVQTKNLPYSTDDVKKLCYSCRICAELKLQFYHPQQNRLIKATQPMEHRFHRTSQIIISEFMLTIVDEYSCFGSSFLSQEIKRLLLSSKTTPYHPIGNGQCECYNSIIWKGVRMALRTQNLSDTQWEIVLQNVLHYIRSLLSTATNPTSHEIFFEFQHRTPCVSALPTWLSVPGCVMLRRFVRNSKNDPLVDKVKLPHLLTRKVVRIVPNTD